MRRIGVLMILAADDPEITAPPAAFLQGLQHLGWTDGRNVRIDTRWTAGNADAFADTRRNWSRSRLTSSWPMAAQVVDALLQATRTVPIVFTHVPDPVGAGFVEACRGRVATPRALCSSSTASAGNG